PFALRLLEWFRRSQTGAQGAARRAAPAADPLGVEVITLGLGPEIADGAPAILDLGREHRLAAQAIFDAGTEGAALGERSELGNAAVLVAGLPAAAVNPHQDRHAALRLLLGMHNVHLDRTVAALAILHVAHQLNVVGHLERLALLLCCDEL